MQQNTVSDKNWLRYKEYFFRRNDMCPQHLFKDNFKLNKLTRQHNLNILATPKG
ncbi:hypothetical protein O3M35_008539 [Rhynocoris fuscipes]|uniref:Uncharacterized protein n=1 Tax=Rhynocoris fuscipes TaxID=488301 RepID=A0AAW1D6K6_9HEMI